MHHVGSPKAYMALYLVQSSVLLFITAAAVSEEKPATCIKCWLLIQKLTEGGKQRYSGRVLGMVAELRRIFCSLGRKPWGTPRLLDLP